MILCLSVFFCYYGKVGTELDWWANIELGQFDNTGQVD